MINVIQLHPKPSIVEAVKLELTNIDDVAKWIRAREVSTYSRKGIVVVTFTLRTGDQLSQKLGTYICRDSKGEYSNPSEEELYFLYDYVGEHQVEVN